MPVQPRWTTWSSLAKSTLPGVTDAEAPLVADDFRVPFIGHLPGYLAATELIGPDRPNADVYRDLLMKQWHALLDSPASGDERLLHTFLSTTPRCCPAATLS